MDRKSEGNNMEGWQGKDCKERERTKDLLGGPWFSLSMLYSVKAAEAKLELSQSYRVFLLVASSLKSFMIQ